MNRVTEEDRIWQMGETFAHLAEDGDVLPIPIDENFWSHGVTKLPPGRLVSLFDMKGNWDVWEMHPKGDEWIYLLAGRAVFILEHPDGPRRHEVAAGHFTIIPKGCWHTADVIEQGKGLFITLGEGTEHKKRA